MKERPNWDEYFMQLAKFASTRATCFSPAKGAVIVLDKNVISTGYNGAPAGMQNCKYDRKECRRRTQGFNSGEGLHLCRGTHAEANAIVQAAKLGHSVKGATMYCSHQPCNDCAKLIINAGIVKVVFLEEYPESESLEWFKEGNVEAYKLIESRLVDLRSISNLEKYSGLESPERFKER